MDIQKSKIHPFDVEELAAFITGLDYDEIDADTSIIEEKIMEDFGCDLSQFSDIISRLIPLIMISKSPLTDKVYKGFVDAKNQMWLVKDEL